MRRSVRAVGVAAVAAFALVSLSACRTNVGTAAVVGGQRISENTVSDQLLASGPSQEGLQEAQKQGASVQSRATVLGILVQERLYTRLLVLSGGVPESGTLEGLRDVALTQLARSPVTGSAAVAGIRGQLQEFGIQPSFVTVYLTALEKEYAYLQRKNITDQASLTATIRQAGITVTVNPRYGRWDSTQSSLDSTGVQPAYLTLQPVVPAQAAS